MIRAVFREGTIKLLDAVPAEWREGQELVVEALAEEETQDSFEEWAADLDAAAAGISDEDHDRLMAALAEADAESKPRGRRDLERSP